MKRYIFTLISMISTLTSFAQVDTTSNISLLSGPISPASNLLGVSSNEIQRPTDVKAFMFSLQNASQNFTSMPTSFAVDLAPYWFGKKGLSLYETTKSDNNILKGLVVSIAARNLQNSKKADSTTQIGLGFRLALLKGKYKRKEVVNMNSAFEEYVKIVDYEISSNNELVSIKAKKDSIANAITPAIKANKEEFNKIRKVIDSLDYVLSINYSGLLSNKEFNKQQSIETIEKFKNLKIVRTGFKVDLAGGIAWDFKETKYSNSKVLNGGLWLTAGNEGEKGHTFLAIARYLITPDKLYKDVEGLVKSKSAGSFDTGVRYNFQMPDSPLNLSSEFVYRNLIEKQFDDSWKWVFNLGYDIGQNTILTLSMGRDFDKTIKKDGNVIAFLNFVKGFGSK